MFTKSKINWPAVRLRLVTTGHHSYKLHSFPRKKNANNGCTLNVSPTLVTFIIIVQSRLSSNIKLSYWLRKDVCLGISPLRTAPVKKCPRQQLHFDPILIGVGCTFCRGGMIRLYYWCGLACVSLGVVRTKWRTNRKGNAAGKCPCEVSTGHSSMLW